MDTLIDTADRTDILASEGGAIPDPRQADLLDQREAAAQFFVARFLGVPVDRVTALKLTGAQ